MIRKILASLCVAFAAIVGAGVSGLSFYLWPTGLGDHRLSVTPEVIQGLHDLQAERKFGLDTTAFYLGARTEAERRMAQAAVDSAIETLITELPKHPQRSTVLRTMKATLANIDTPESEERDQILIYLTRVMEICGVESSSELFNVWRYGFPYGWLM